MPPFPDRFLGVLAPWWFLCLPPLAAFAAGCRGIEQPPAPTVTAEPAAPAQPAAGRPAKTAIAPEAAGEPPTTPAALQPVAASPPQTIAGAPPPAAELSDDLLQLLRKHKKDAVLDLDADGQPEVQLHVRGDGAAEITVRFKSAAGVSLRRYLVDEAGRILRFVRDDDGDGIAEEVLLAGAAEEPAASGKWLRVLAGEKAYYVMQGSDSDGLALAWHTAEHLPPPLTMAKMLATRAAAPETLLARPEVESYWRSGRRCLYRNRPASELGAPLLQPAGWPSVAPANVVPAGKLATPRSKPRPPVPKELAGCTDVPAPAGGSSVLAAPLRVRGQLLFVLAANGEQRLLLPEASRHSPRGLPEELLRPPAGRLLCRLVHGQSAGLEKPVFYETVAGDWEGWYDTDGDGLRDGRIVRWGRESVLEYRAESMLVTELRLLGRLVERRFRPPDETASRMVEYYGSAGLVRREIDANGDGRFERLEFPDDTGGWKVYLDTNGDGLPDRWLEKRQKGETDAGKGDKEAAGDAG